MNQFTITVLGYKGKEMRPRKIRCKFWDTTPEMKRHMAKQGLGFSDNGVPSGDYGACTYLRFLSSGCPLSYDDMVINMAFSMDEFSVYVVTHEIMHAALYLLKLEERYRDLGAPYKTYDEELLADTIACINATFWSKFFDKFGPVDVDAYPSDDSHKQEPENQIVEPAKGSGK